eukprot:SAG31_NODE_301_length_18103_cov_13.772551_13_plen_215_part_00
MYAGRPYEPSGPPPYNHLEPNSAPPNMGSGMHGANIPPAMVIENANVFPVTQTHVSGAPKKLMVEIGSEGLSIFPTVDEKFQMLSTFDYADKGEGLLATGTKNTDTFDFIEYQSIRSWTSDIPQQIVLRMFVSETETKKMLFKTTEAQLMTDQIGQAVANFIADRHAKRIPISQSFWAPWEGYSEPTPGHKPGKLLVGIAYATKTWLPLQYQLY